MNKLEYVISGLGMTRIPLESYTISKKLVDATIEAFQKKYKNNDNVSDISLLFNAFTEKGFLPILKDVNFYELDCMVDSGGLQMLSQGKNITNDLKNKVYQIQSEANGLSMSFDEMPLIIKEGTTDTRTDSTTKNFVASMITEKASNSGKNVLEQLRVFEKNRSNSKAMIIVHGNKIEDFHKYFDVLMKEIPKELYDYIGGIAMAGTCCGMGTIESCNTIMAYSTMNIPDELKGRIHFLGFGSISRLMPIIQLMKSGVISNDVSYDSSTHSSKYFIGGQYVLPKNKNVSYGKTRSDKSDKILTDIYYQFSDIIQKYWNCDLDEWLDVCSESFGSALIFQQPDRRKSELCMLNVFLNCLGGVKNFTDELETYINTNRLNNYNTPLKFLSEVANLNDYEYWLNEFHPFLSGKPISRFDTIEKYEKKNRNLSDFFS